MAITAEALGSRLQLVLQTGTAEDGKPVLKTRSYSRIKTDAADQNVYDTALALVGLQEHTLNSVRRVDESALEESI